MQTIELTEECYAIDLRHAFARGFAVQTVGPLLIAFTKQTTVVKGGWGLRCVMDYTSPCAMGACRQREARRTPD